MTKHVHPYSGSDFRSNVQGHSRPAKKEDAKFVRILSVEVHFNTQQQTVNCCDRGEIAGVDYVR